jgi:hypothetical protein
MTANNLMAGLALFVAVLMVWSAIVQWRHRG